MKTVQAYVQGTRHVRQGKVCQDRTGFLNQNNVCAIALSDGAGNPKYTYSEYGAEVVVDTITRFFCNNFDHFYETQDDKKLSEVLIAVLLKELEKKAAELKADSVVRLSSTMLAVAVKGKKAIICHLGDGAIGAVTDEATTVISSPENGEYANSTYFVTGVRAADHVKIIKKTITDELGFFLMSDGTADYCYDDVKNEFREGARKMALIAYDDKADELLAKTIAEKMIADDTNSDDCSFISLMLSDRYSFEGTAQRSVDPVRRDKTSSTYEGPAKSEIPVREKTVPEVDRTENKPAAKKNMTGLVIALAGSVALVVVLAAMLFNRKTDVEEAAQEQSSTPVVEEVTQEVINEEEETQEPEAVTEEVSVEVHEVTAEEVHEETAEESTESVAPAKSLIRKFNTNLIDMDK